MYYQSQGQSLQLPPSCKFPLLREGNRVGRVGSVPPASRGNLKEGVIGHTRFCELWLRDWYTLVRPAGGGQLPFFVDFGSAIGVRNAADPYRAQV